MTCKECQKEIRPRIYPCKKVGRNSTYCSDECRLKNLKRRNTWAWSQLKGLTPPATVSDNKD